MDSSGGEARHGETGNEATDTSRVNGFSDGVFAVAITLLILTISVPVISDIDRLPSELKALWPNLLGFLISFLIIGAFWIDHHQMFMLLQRTDFGLLWINLIFLMCIVMLPFSTELMSEYGDSATAVIFYDLNMVAASLTLSLLWWYMSHRHGLVKKDVDPGTRKHLLLTFLSVSLVFALSAAIAPVNTSVSQYLYFLLIPNRMLLERKRRKDMGRV